MQMWLCYLSLPFVAPCHLAFEKKNCDIRSEFDSHSCMSIFLKLGIVLCEGKWKMKYDLYSSLAKLLLLDGKIHLLNASRLELALQ